MGSTNMGSTKMRSIRPYGAYLGLTLVALLSVLPVLYILSLSLQSLREASAIPATLVPSTPHWANFQDILQRIPLPKFFWNSLLYSLSTTALLILTATPAAYAITKLRIPGSALLTAFFVGSILVPPDIRVIPLYSMVASWGWVDTWAGLSLPIMTTGFGLFFMRQYMLTLPDEVIEAARIDGCSEWQILLRIIAPLAVPGMFTLALFNFIFRWNDYLWPLVVTRENWRTLPVGLAVFKSSEQLITWNLIAAGAVITLLPLLILFFALRERILAGIALQAGK